MSVHPYRIGQVGRIGNSHLEFAACPRHAVFWKNNKVSFRLEHLPIEDQKLSAGRQLYMVANTEIKINGVVALIHQTDVEGLIPIYSPKA